MNNNEIQNCSYTIDNPRTIYLLIKKNVSDTLGKVHNTNTLNLLNKYCKEVNDTDKSNICKMGCK